MWNSKSYGLVILSIAVFLALLLSCNERKVNVVNTSYTKFDSTLVSVDNDRFTFHIKGTFKDLRREDIYSQMVEVNPNLLIMALIDLPHESTAISVHKYSDSIKHSIDDAFKISIDTKASFNNQSVGAYKLIDYGVYKLGDKTLRFKVSCIGDTMVNTMYYFMKDDYDYDLYELKISCSKQSQQDSKKYLENMALTVAIK
jgi:hypothetical protein